jgi:hypothetical protein
MDKAHWYTGLLYQRYRGFGGRTPAIPEGNHLIAAVSSQDTG